MANQPALNCQKTSTTASTYSYRAALAVMLGGSSGTEIQPSLPTGAVTLNSLSPNSEIDDRCANMRYSEPAKA